MDLVCASPTAHQFGSVLGMRRLFASGSPSLVCQTSSSAFYGEIVLDIVWVLGGEILFPVSLVLADAPPKNKMKEGRIPLLHSALDIRPFPLEKNRLQEQKKQDLQENPHHSRYSPPKKPNYIPQSLPIEGGSHREPLANDLLRERIAKIGEQSDLHKLYPSPPPYKSFAELFQKRPSPRSPRPPVLLPNASTYSTGKVNQKRVPEPGVDWTPKRAPARTRIFLTIESPRPVPISARLW